MDSELERDLIICVFVLCLTCCYTGVSATNDDCLNHTVTDSVCISGVCACNDSDTLIDSACLFDCLIDDDCLNHTVTDAVCISGVCACNVSDTLVDSACIFDCGSPQAPTNGSVSTANRTLQGDVATYQCEAGFDLFGNQEVTCTRSGWGSAPTCEFRCQTDADCTAISNQTCNTSTNNCECPENYTVYENACLYNCGDPPEFYVDGNRLTWYYYYGFPPFLSPLEGILEDDWVLYECPFSNYSIIGDRYVDCEVGGWENINPLCHYNCSTVPDISNGTIALDDPGNTTEGATATVSCDTGYTENITCLETGWEDADCNLDIDCLIDDDCFNHTVTDSVCISGVCACNESDTLVESACLFDCGSPQTPTNGSVSTYYGTLQGDEATYQCEAGFKLIGNQEVTCTRSGWGSAPSCEFGCLTDDDCTSIDTQICNTSIYDCECPENYTAYAGDCLYNCGDPPEFYVDGNKLTWSPFFFATIEGTLEGDYLQYSCPFSNYSIFGDYFGECQIGGWININPLCLYDCTTVPDISNGTITLDDQFNTTEGATATVSCDNGYTKIITCLDTGWEDADCNLNDCGSPQAPSNGSVSTDNGTLQGDVATFQCEAGFKLIGNQEVTCTRSGWESSPSCEFGCLTDDDCTSIDAQICNTSIYDCECPQNYTTHVNECLYKCGDPPEFYVDGNRLTWFIVFFIDASEGALEGDYIIYECPFSNYSMVNDGIWACEVGGWRDINPLCLYNCSTVPELFNGTITLDDPFNTTEGATATVSCDNGYTENITCLDTGWEDADCTIGDINECESDPCQNGTCIDGINGYTCTCEAGFTDTNCSTDINECESDPCQNGICIDGINGYTCNCEAGFTDINCSTDIYECESDPCQNGTCIDGINGYTCTCEAGFTDTNCSTDINECESDPCQNGTCIDGSNGYTCDCGAGFTDTNCSTDINDCEPDPCQNGTCIDGINGYTCDCEAGFTDINCSTDINECESDPCQNGTCIDGINGYTCNCEAGYTDTNCSTDIDECAADLCQNGATCIDETNDYNCTCVGGYTGTNCETNIDECESEPCQNGTCIDGINEYTCDCETGFTDTNCSTDCTVTPDISNGIVTLIQDGNAIYANVTCETGYNIIKELVKCLGTGYWEFTTCEIIDCGEVQIINQGTVILQVESNTAYGALANVTCDEGYNASAKEIQCLDSGTWEYTSCEIIDCGEVQIFPKGTVVLQDESNTAYGALANVTCDDGYNASPKEVQCLDSGAWEYSLCEIIDCEEPHGILNGTITLVNESNRDYGALATVTCDEGYNTSAKTIQCLDTGDWKPTSCEIIDCGNLEDISNGTVNISQGTEFGASASYNCDTGLTLVGDETRDCKGNGKWGGMEPVCVESGGKQCSQEQDQRKTDWQEVVAGQVRTYQCGQGFSGIKSRKCTQEGTWEQPKYDCTRETVTNMIAQINSIDANATQQDLINVLNELESVTTQQETTVQEDRLTDGEIRVLVDSLAKVSQLLNTAPALLSEDITNALIGSASNLVDKTNSGSWGTLLQTDSSVAETILAAVDAIGKALGDAVSSGKVLPPVVKKNLALQAKEVSSDVFIFPGQDVKTGDMDDNTEWLVNTKSKVHLDPASLQGKSYVAIAAIYKDLSDILPHESEDEKLNGQVVSFSTTPSLTGTINPSIKLTFQHTDTEFTKPSCSFWKFESGSTGYWSSEGCNVSSVQSGVTECECNHLTNFAVILSLQDCGSLENPTNGKADTSSGTTYNSAAKFKCNDGYLINGTDSSVCLFNGSWSSNTPYCIPKDCGPLRNPRNGRVDNSSGTTYTARASFSCDDGFIIDDIYTRICLANGSWSLPIPICNEIETVIPTCEESLDSRGFTWVSTQAGNTRNELCVDGFTGFRTRICRSDGTWQFPQYDCVRESVQEVDEAVANLNVNATEDEVSDVLKKITEVSVQDENVQEEERLTGGELSVLSTSLQKVADVIALSPDILNENITDDFLESTSSLLDNSNQRSWQSLSASESNEAENVLKAVDSFTTALSKNIETSEKNSTVIVKKNLAVEVRKFDKTDVIFPPPDETLHYEDENVAGWIKESQSSLRLDSASLKNDTINYITTTVMYRDMSSILPVNNIDSSSETSEEDEEEADEEIINAAILSLTISPPVTAKLNPPVRLTFQHNGNNLTSPNCVFWKFQNNSSRLGYWSTEGCSVTTTNETFTVCECDHLTNFAVLMSPFTEADASSKALRIISIVGIGISIACLIATFCVHFHLWRYLRNDRTTVLMNLCVALLLSYIIFLAGVDRTESTVACAAIAAVLQYIYLVVFCIMLVEGIEIAVTVLYVFKTKSRIKIMLFLAWVIPAAIVGISLGVTKAVGYGNDNYCWLSVDKGLIWAFVGPALLIITFNGICLIIVIRTMFKTKAMESKKASEKIKTSFRSLCVLLPVMGVSWILGIFYVSDSFYFIQYIFAILNGLQGFFIFLFHCLLNTQVKRALSLRKRRRSSRATLKSTVRSTSKEERNVKDLRDMGKSYLDSGEYTQETSDNWKETILQPQPSPEALKFSTPLGLFGAGRRVATFNADSRDQLTGDVSRVHSEHSAKLSERLQTQLFSNRL